MGVSRRSLATTFLALLAAPALAHETLDPSIRHDAKDGVVRLYGAGGPDTALKKVAAAFTAETGITVEVTGGPEPSWSKKAQADADIIWGTAQEDMTALLETYTNFAWADVMPIYIRPAIIAVRKGNPKAITGFEDLLKPGMRIVVTLKRDAVARVVLTPQPVTRILPPSTVPVPKERSASCGRP